MPSPNTHQAADQAHWLEQAAMALDYANARPASDLDGFFAAHRDREQFLALAEAA